MIRAGRLHELVLQFTAIDPDETYAEKKPMWLAVLANGHCIAGGMRDGLATKHMDLTHLLGEYGIDFDKYEHSDPWITNLLEDF